MMIIEGLTRSGFISTLLSSLALLDHSFLTTTTIGLNPTTPIFLDITQTQQQQETQTQTQQQQLFLNDDVDIQKQRTKFAKSLRKDVAAVLDDDPTLTGSLIRLAFHDATTYENSKGLITGGPNGSIRYEEEKSENRGIHRPLQVVERIYSKIIANYNNDINNNNINNNNNLLFLPSFADCIALAGAAAIEHAGGPYIPIRLGRIDVTNEDPEYLRVPVHGISERSYVTKTYPSAGLDSYGLRLYFDRLGLSESEFVALSGLHGLGRHVSLLGMSKECLKNLTRQCLEDAPVLLPFVTKSVDKLDNNYFIALLNWNQQNIKLGDVAFIPTDVALVVDNDLQKYVTEFASNKKLYFKTLLRSYQKLVENPTTTNVLLTKERY